MYVKIVLINFEKVYLIIIISTKKFYFPECKIRTPSPNQAKRHSIIQQTANTEQVLAYLCSMGTWWSKTIEF